MGELVPVEEIPAMPDGRPLACGMFCVAHKADTDRLIFNRPI